MAESKATTVRFADQIYERLEKAGKATGLPINSIVVVAVLDWLEAHPPEFAGRGQSAWMRTGSIPAEWLREARPGALVRKLPWPASPTAFDQFSRSAQSALARAQEIAEASGEGQITTSHLLLALRRTGLAARVLEALEVGDLEARLAPPEAEPKRGVLLPTSRVRTVIKLAMEEAEAAHMGYVGTEHLLLGVIREGESSAAGLLFEINVGEAEVRAQIAKLAGAEET